MNRWAVPTLSGIQRTTAMLALVLGAILTWQDSPAAGFGCVIGAGVMIANLYALAWLGRGLLALAHQSGGATRLGIVAAPLKMVILIAIVYFIIQSNRIDMAGFLAGSLTQFAAVFIETWRASAASSACRTGDV